MRLFLLLLLFLSACTPEKEKPLFNPSNLESYFVKVNHEKDNLISTPKGAVVRIKKGTFVKDVELEIKEAYTMKDIVLGGLVTTTNGKPLRSGGMIYINERDGNEIEVLQPIDVILPTNYVDENMKLYKGEFSEDDSLNWVEIDTLQPTALDKSIEAGKQIYLNSCHSCHGIRVPLSGPALAGVWDRGPWKEDRKNLLRWVNNPGAFIPTTGYTRNLQRTWGSIMPSYPQLDEADISSVMNFIRNEAASPVTDTFTHPGRSADSVGTFQNSNCLDTGYVDVVDPIEPVSEELAAMVLEDDSQADSLDAFNPKNGAYYFQVESLGWFNIDVRLEILPSLTTCEINVQLEGVSDLEDMKVYALFPSEKNYTVSNEFIEGIFKFNTYKGKGLPLYLGEQGFIIAYGMLEGKFYYGFKEFQVKTEQHIKVMVSVSSENAFLEDVKNNRFNNNQPLKKENPEGQNNIPQPNLDFRRDMIVSPCKDSTSSPAASPAAINVSL